MMFNSTPTMISDKALKVWNKLGPIDLPEYQRMNGDQEYEGVEYGELTNKCDKYSGQLKDGKMHGLGRK